MTLVEEGFEFGFAKEQVSESKEDFEASGRVFVNTGCTCFFDAEQLVKGEMLEKFRKARSGDDLKASRDVLRSSGGAVRYGFNRLGDELGVFLNSKKNILALWPESNRRSAKE